MLNAAHVLPAGPGERDDAFFPLQHRLRLRDNFGFVLRQLRESAAFQHLEKGPWAVFSAISAHFQLNVEAWPSQDTIARYVGCSTRAVRYHLRVLERGGFLTIRRERRADGSERLFYGPGPLLLRALAAFTETYPKDRAKVLRSAPDVAPTFSPPAENFSDAPAEPVAMEPRDQDQIKPSSCEGAPAVAPTVAVPPAVGAFEEEQLRVSQEDREIARWALSERMKRKQPKKPPPRWFDRADVELVAACTATIDGERAAKEQAHLEAIVGAFCASKDGPPTARFIWQKLEHFEDHRVRGRTRLAALAVEEQRHLGGRDHCGRHEPVPDRAADSREASDSVPREQVDADLERLFGAGWRGPKPSDCERASTWTAGVNGRTTQ